MADRSPEARSASYAALISAVAGARRDPATARFDDELAAAEAAGLVDPAVARTLRWWQRESVRAVEDHLQDVLPGLVASLEAADEDAVQSVSASATSWAVASGESAGRQATPPPEDPDPGPGRATPPGPPGPPPGGGHGFGDTAPYLRPVDRAGDTPGDRPRLLRPGFAPPAAGSPRGTRPDRPVTHDPDASGAPPRRLLVGGLTVLTEADGTAPSAAPPHRSTGTRDDLPGTTR